MHKSSLGCPQHATQSLQLESIEVIRNRTSSSKWMSYEVNAGALFIERISLGEYLYYNPELLTQIQNILKPGRITHSRKLSSYSRSLGVDKSHTHREYFISDYLNLTRQVHVYPHVHICECVELCLSFCTTVCLFLQVHSMNTLWPVMEQWKEYSLGILSPLSVLVSTSYERKLCQTPSKTGGEEWVHLWTDSTFSRQTTADT